MKTIGQRIQTDMETNKKNASKMVLRKKHSKSTEKRKCKVKYTINKTKSAIYD